MTIVDFQRSDWTDDGTGGTAETTPSVSWQAGDLILVFGMTENTSGAGGTLSTPTGTGLTFSLITSFTSGGAPAWAWSATAGSSGSSAISTTRGLFGSHAICVYVIRGHGGIGNSSATRASTKVRSLTRSGDNSAVFQCAADWNAVNDVAVTASPAGGTVDAAVFDSGAATYFSLSWLDQGAAGSTSYGIADHTGTVDLTSILVEVLEGEGGGGEELTLEVSDSLTFGDAPAKQAGKVSVEVLAMGEDRSLNVGKAFVDGLTMAESRALILSKALTDAVTMGDTRALEALKSLADSISVEDAKALSVGKVLEDSLVLAEVRSLLFSKGLSDGIVMSDSAQTIVTLVLELLDTLAFSDDQVLAFTKGVQDNLSIQDSLTRLLSKSLSDDLNVVDSAQALVTIVLQVIDSLSLSDSQTKAVEKALTEAVAIADIASRLAQKLALDTLSFADAVTTGFLKQLQVSDSFSVSDLHSLQHIIGSVVRVIRLPLEIEIDVQDYSLAIDTEDFDLAVEEQTYDLA